MLLVVKNPPADAGDVRDADSVPGSGRSPGGRHGNLFQYSCLENPMNRGAWWLESIRSQRVGHNWSDWTSMQHTFSAGQWSTFQEYRNWASPSLEVLMYLKEKSHNLSHNFREIGAPESRQPVPYLTYQPWQKLKGVSSHSSFLVCLSNSILLFLSCGCLVAKSCPTLLWPHGL